MSPPFTKDNAALHGRSGGLKGGKARAKELSAKDRMRIARKAWLASALARAKK